MNVKFITQKNWIFIFKDVNISKSATISNLSRKAVVAVGSGAIGIVATVIEFALSVGADHVDATHDIAIASSDRNNVSALTRHTDLRWRAVVGCGARVARRAWRRSRRAWCRSRRAWRCSRRAWRCSSNTLPVFIARLINWAIVILHL